MLLQHELNEETISCLSYQGTVQFQPKQKDRIYKINDISVTVEKPILHCNSLIKTIIDLFTDMAAILNLFDLKSIIGYPGGMSPFRLYFRVLFGTFFLKVFLE